MARSAAAEVDQGVIATWAEAVDAAAPIVPEMMFFALESEAPTIMSPTGAVIMVADAGGDFVRGRVFSMVSTEHSFLVTTAGDGRARITFRGKY